MRRLRGTIRLKSTELWETTTLGYCITLRHRLTLHHISFRNRSICLIRRVTSGYYQNSRDHSGERDSSRLVFLIFVHFFD